MVIGDWVQGMLDKRGEGMEEFERRLMQRCRASKCHTCVSLVPREGCRSYATCRAGDTGKTKMYKQRG